MQIRNRAVETKTLDAIFVCSQIGVCFCIVDRIRQWTERREIQSLTRRVRLGLDECCSLLNPSSDQQMHLSALIEILWFESPTKNKSYQWKMRTANDMAQGHSHDWNPFLLVEKGLWEWTVLVAHWSIARSFMLYKYVFVERWRIIAARSIGEETIMPVSFWKQSVSKSSTKGTTVLCVKRKHPTKEVVRCKAFRAFIVCLCPRSKSNGCLVQHGFSQLAA